MRDIEIDNYLKLIIDKPVISISRACNMMCLGFGNWISTMDYKGNKDINCSIYLHVQSSWRVANREEKVIHFASIDIYTPNSSLEWSNEFDWDIQGANLFDEKSKEWFKNNQDIYVKEYRINRWGDLILLFSNKDSLEIFVNASDNSECWRLFEYESTNDHFVVTGQGVVFEYDK